MQGMFRFVVLIVFVHLLYLCCTVGMFYLTTYYVARFNIYLVLSPDIFRKSIYVSQKTLTPNSPLHTQPLTHIKRSSNQQQT